MSKVVLVVTSISKPNQILKQLAEGAVKHQWQFVVVGDLSSPKDFHLGGCNYYNIDQQMETGFLSAQKCLTKHYARKNVGYLIAIKNGADIIVETDDDNMPLESFWQTRIKIKEASLIKHQGWVNVYRCFSNDLIWPRGFPLNMIHQKQNISEVDFRKIDAPIQQGLANGNPDVDAVYRLVMPLPFNFNLHQDIALDKGAWCPFNSQNTTWWKEVFPLLYLPSYCSFRMTDIWRSLIAQKILWANNKKMIFHKPTVYQERNEHNLMKDFADEVSGYLQVSDVQALLSQMDILPGFHQIPEAMRQCYACLVKKDIFDVKELDILDAWLKDLELLSLE